MIVAWLTFSNLLYQFSRISQIQACAVYLVKKISVKNVKIVLFGGLSHPKLQS